MNKEYKTFLNILLFILLIGAMLNPFSIFTLFKKYSGIDFYHFWSVNTILKITKYRSGSPYSNSPLYAELLSKLAQRTLDQKFFRAQKFRNKPEFTGSPLLYMMFSIFPINYTNALFLIRALSILAFISAIIIIGNCNSGKQYEILPLINISFAAILAFEPFHKDLIVGNINCFQLFFLAILIVLVNYPKSKIPINNRIIGIIQLVLIVFLVLLKLNLLIICSVFLLFIWSRTETREFVKNTIVALIIGLIIFLLPCLYFQHWGIWLDWIKYTFLSDNNYLICPINLGNYSTSYIAAQCLKTKLLFSIITCGLFWILSFIMILLGSNSLKNEKDFFTFTKNAFLKICNNLNLLVILGITITISLYPLVWYHYYILFFIPVLFILQFGNRTQAILAIISIIMCSGLIKYILIIIGLPNALVACICLSWIPLWMASLIELRKTLKSTAEKITTEPTVKA